MLNPRISHYRNNHWQKNGKVIEILLQIFEFMTAEYNHKRFHFLVLENEELYLKNLPSVECYEKSYMHRDIITHIIVSQLVS